MAVVVVVVRWMVVVVVWCWIVRGVRVRVLRVEGIVAGEGEEGEGGTTAMNGSGGGKQLRRIRMYVLLAHGDCLVSRVFKIVQYVWLYPFQTGVPDWAHAHLVGPQSTRGHFSDSRHLPV